MKELNIAKVSEKVIEQLPKGALLTVKSKDKLNTMTIGWATLGRVWNKPIMTVLVRFSRFTHDIISDSDSFTVSFSFDGSLKQAIGVCGEKSGRDMDKLKELGLTLFMLIVLNHLILMKGPPFSSVRQYTKILWTSAAQEVGINSIKTLTIM